MELRRERARLATYRSWTNTHVSPEELSSAGFYYIGPKDRVRCFMCDLELVDWQEGDKPLLAHLKWQPNCTFAKVSTITAKSDAATSTEEDLKVSTVSIAQEPLLRRCLTSPTAPNSEISLLSYIPCRICRRQIAGTLFLPCGHICACTLCATTMIICPCCGLLIVTYLTATFH